MSTIIYFMTQRNQEQTMWLPSKWRGKAVGNGAWNNVILKFNLFKVNDFFNIAKNPSRGTGILRYIIHCPLTYITIEDFIKYCCNTRSLGIIKP